MTDADGADWPPDDWFLRVLRQGEKKMSDPVGFGLGLNPATRSLTDRLAPGEELNRERIEREMATPTTPSRRRMLLEREAARHEQKAARARELAESLGSIPDADPFPDHTVLMLVRGGYTFVVLRVAGFWYTTGGTGLGLTRATWETFVGWLADGGVELVYPMTRGEPAPLDSLAPSPAPAAGEPLRRVRCNASFVTGAHLAHAWPQDDPTFWCDGQPEPIVRIGGGTDTQGG